MRWKKWRHVTKLDPDKNLPAEDIKRIVESGTDAIMVSGTQRVTGAKVRRLMRLLNDCEIPVILEPSHPGLVKYAKKHIFVPCVLNSMSAEWIVGMHKEWIKRFEIEWDKIVPEAYIVLNPESSVAKLANTRADIDKNEIIAYATCAERYFRFPIVYLEYSGSYGDPQVVKAVSEVQKNARLFYGGGIDSKARAKEILQYADTIVVGNAFYRDLDKALETIC